MPKKSALADDDVVMTKDGDEDDSGDDCEESGEEEEESGEEEEDSEDDEDASGEEEDDEEEEEEEEKPSVTKKKESNVSSKTPTEKRQAATPPAVEISAPQKASPPRAGRGKGPMTEEQKEEAKLLAKERRKVTDAARRQRKKQEALAAKATSEHGQSGETEPPPTTKKAAVPTGAGVEAVTPDPVASADEAVQLFDLPPSAVENPPTHDPDEYILFVNGSMTYKVPMGAVQMNKKTIDLDFTADQLEIVRKLSYTSPLDDNTRRVLDEKMKVVKSRCLPEMCAVKVLVYPTKKSGADDVGKETYLYMFAHKADDNAIRYYPMPLVLSQWLHSSRLPEHIRALTDGEDEKRAKNPNYVTDEKKIGYLNKVNEFLEYAPLETTGYFFDPDRQGELFQCVGKEGEFTFAETTQDSRFVTGITSSPAVKTAAAAETKGASSAAAKKASAIKKGVAPAAAPEATSSAGDGCAKKRASKKSAPTTVEVVNEPMPDVDGGGAEKVTTARVPKRSLENGSANRKSKKVNAATATDEKAAPTAEEEDPQKHILIMFYNAEETPLQLFQGPTENGRTAWCVTAGSRSPWE